ncbi:MAG: DegT/DnrJ/EryC1/StrS family aminotransferase [Candidatus Omnitrophica bacterium]|nr:DegT/DnrJ/EryC1/StrS family aminotransferase [Candidatus Omnitrophota bacterium]
MKTKIPRNRLYFKKTLLIKAFAFLFTPKALEGEYVEIFEKEFKDFIGARHAIAVSSGKLALYLCLKYLGAEKGDKVILSDFNVPEVPALLASSGFIPVLVDIDRDTFNINPDLIEQNIDKRTKFIVVTHMFGVPAEIKRICTIAKKHNLKIIEDACQALGSEYQGHKVGIFGDAGYFSLGLLKPLSALNGGIIVTNNNELANNIRKEIAQYSNIERIKLFKDLIKTGLIIFLTNKEVFNYLTYPLLSLLNRFNKQIKFNILQGKEISCISSKALGRMKVKFSNLQAMVGVGNLSILPEIIKNILEKSELLSKLLIESGIIVQRSGEGSLSAYFKYVIKVHDREAVLNSLFRLGIDTTYGYMKACSSICSLFKYSTSCTESMLLTNENIYLPVNSLNSNDDVHHLAKTLKEITKKLQKN